MEGASSSAEFFGLRRDVANFIRKLEAVSIIHIYFVALGLLMFFRKSSTANSNLSLTLACLRYMSVTISGSLYRQHHANKNLNLVENLSVHCFIPV